MAATLVKGTSKVALKVAVAAGAVYVTVNQGIWSTNRNPGWKALTEAKGSVREFANQIPTGSMASESAVDTWNSGVKYVFSSLADAPATAKWAADSVMKSLK